MATSSADRQLIAAIERHEALADTRQLTKERAEAIQRYRGDNTMPADEGRSQYVSRDVYDVVETVKPQLIKLFLSGDEVVRFDPTGPEDVEQAKLETQYINYIALEKNDAFQVFDAWIHDGLVQRMGYVLPYYDDSEQIDRETYEGLGDDELALLVQAGDVEVVEHEQTERGHVVTVERVSGGGCVRMLNIPPERVKVDADHREVSLKNAAFVQWLEQKTLSQLRAEGFDVPDDLSDGGLGDEGEDEEQTRHEERLDEDEPADPAMRQVWVRTTWIRTSLYSGGKRAELRRVIVVGTTILENEPADSIDLIAWCPHPMPHQHVGLSKVDEVRDIADIKTAMNRAMLDNMYMANNGRYAINTELVNLDDMLVSRPGGVVRVDGAPGDAIFPLVAPQTQNVALQAVEYFDQVREARTGMSRYTSGLDPNALNKTATGIMQLQAASMQRIELIGRRLAEAVKELFVCVHRLTLKHGRREEMVRLNNKFVPIDPRSWKRRVDMSISVGLGTGNRQEQSGFLMQMLQLALGPGMQLGLTDEPRIYAMLARLTNNAGFKSAEEFWVDPTGQPPKQQPPDPKLLIEQAKLQQAQQETQVEVQTEQLKIQADMQIEREKIASAERIEQAKLAAQLERDRMQVEAQQRAAKAAAIAPANKAFIAKLRTTRVRNA